MKMSVIYILIYNILIGNIKNQEPFLVSSMKVERIRIVKKLSNKVKLEKEVLALFNY